MAMKWTEEQQKVITLRDRNIRQLNVCYKAFAAFHPLDRIFINIKALYLEHIGQLPLGDIFHLQAQLPYFLSAYII